MIFTYCYLRYLEGIQVFKKYDFNLNVLGFDFDWLTLKIFKCI